jgi:superfamily II DNA or RNA helicase
VSFVPTTGPAVFHAAEPPRQGVVEFSGVRSVRLPITAALPVRAKAHQAGDVHPSVSLLAGAAHLALRLVADGRFEPHPTQPWWRLAPLGDADRDRVEQLSRARAYGDLDPAGAEGVVRKVLEAVVDAMPRRAPTRPVAVPDYTDRLTDRIQRLKQVAAGDDRPQLVSLSLRVEADEDELYAGELRVVPQVHAENNATHVADAAELWLESGVGAGHGFGDRARTHATLALRQAADAWPVLDRLLELRVPDRITLGADEVTDLLEHGLGALNAVGVDVHWPRELGRELTSRAVLDRSGRKAPSPDAPLQTGMLGAADLFAFRWQVSLHGDPLTDEEMARLAAAASPVVRLRDSWVVVDPEVAKRARKRLIRTVKPAQAVAAALTGVVEVEESPDVEVVVGASLLKVRDQLRAAATREPVPVPASLDATLRDYQRQGLTWLAELTGMGLGACLADDMGLGKTVTLIALHLHRAEERRAAGEPAGSTLVVCPASLLGNWEAEIHRFAPGVPVRRFHGGTRSLHGLAPAAPGDGSGAGADESGADVADELALLEESVLTDPAAEGGFVLTTYGTMRNDAETLGKIAWDLVVADEAQHVKNARSSTAKALRTVGSRARVALTGTPVENDLTELWAILDWVIPGLLGSRLAFRRTWAAPIEAGVDPKITERFADLISPFLLRRRKSDPGIAPELPPKTETDHLLGLTREQAVLYESFVRDRMERIERSEPEARRGLVLAMLTGLKQICNHPAHFLKQTNPTLVGRSEKIDLLDELLGTVLAEDGAALIFTQYVAMARLLELHLTRAGLPHQFLHGGTPVAEREAMVRRFQAGPDAPDSVPVFLLSLKAGGTGLNLTRADHVIHLDRWWNPAVEEQATDRAYRIGQTRPVQVHRMITEGTVEQRIAALLERKRGLADSVLAGGEAALTELSNAELRDLVTLR